MNIRFLFAAAMLMAIAMMAPLITNIWPEMLPAKTTLKGAFFGMLTMWLILLAAYLDSQRNRPSV